MLDSFALLSAMRGIREDYVLDAASILDYKKEMPKKQHYSHKLWGTLLIAAIIVSLFSITAYALGWFGLSARVIPSQEGYPDNPSTASQSGGWVAANGFADSPEAKASMEWEQTYWKMHTEAVGDSGADWPENMGEYADAAMIYGVYNQEMLEELLRIQEKYDLRLHTGLSSSLTTDSFFKIAGIEPFLTADENAVNWQGHYVFEDGSFKGEGRADLEGKTYWYSLTRSKTGVLAPYCLYLHDAMSFDEWQSETEGGIIYFALHSLEQGTEGFVFYQSETWFITISFYSESTIGKTDVEHFSKLFNFNILCQTNS